MAKFSELPAKAQLGIIVGVAVALAGAFYFLVLKGKIEENKQAREALVAKQRQVEMLRPYEAKLADLNRTIVSLQMQIEIQKKIVPDVKAADQFMHLMQDTAGAAGIEVRRYLAETGSTKEFYTEVPFTIDIDGPYYAVLNFFEKVAKLERIINITGLQMSTVKKPMDAKVKKSYQYAPGESVVASAKAITFYSHEPKSEPAPAAGAKPGAAGQPVKK